MTSSTMNIGAALQFKEMSCQKNSQNNANILLLSVPTIFEEYNIKNNLPPSFALEKIILKELRLKDFEEINPAAPPEEQMKQLLYLLTGLSIKDIGKLTIKDSAELLKQITKIFDPWRDLIAQVQKNP